MAAFGDAGFEYQRKRFMRPDAYRYWRPDAQRWMSPEAWRLLGPGDPPREATPLREQKRSPDLLREPAKAIEAEREKLFRLKRILADLKFDLVLRRFARKYSPDQPRVPVGNPDGGQWTSALAIAGMPRIPGQRPPTGPEQTGVAKELALWLAEMGLSAFDVIARGSWLYDSIPNIVSYLDAPKSLGELQEDISTPKAGYDVHHIVERASAAADGYPIRRIDASDNLVRIPRMKHWEINAWYQRPNENFGGASPREYLRYKDWDERERVGLDALRQSGVLKP